MAIGNAANEPITVIMKKKKEKLDSYIHYYICYTVHV